MKQPKIEIEERLSLMGYAHFEDERGSGRMFWSVDPMPSGKGHHLSLSASRGLPLDDTMNEIKHRIIRHVQDPKREGASIQMATERDP